MSAKKIFITIIMVLALTLSLFSCKKKEESPVFCTSLSERPALTSAIEVPLGNKKFHSFLNRRLICVTEQGEDSLLYGVIDETGKEILPAEYSSLSMVGDFFLAGGNLTTALFFVFNRAGEEIFHSDSALTIRDCGGGYVSVTEEGKAYLYDEKGQNVLPGTSLDSSYKFLSCGDFVIAKSASANALFVFHAGTSEVVLSFFGNDQIAYSAFYLGGNDFIVLCDRTVTSSDDYTLAKKTSEQTTYLKQTVYRYTVGVSTPKVLSVKHHLESVNDRYSFELTQEDRETYALNAGYYAVRYYVADGKVTDGSLAYYLSDASLSELKSLPEGISPVITMWEGLGVTSAPSGAIYYLDDKLNVVKIIDDAQYQSVVFSGGGAVASKLVENGTRRRGAFDREGNVLIPFEYSYISDFVGKKAVVSVGENSYLADGAGNKTFLAKESFPFLWDGFYIVVQGEKTGLLSFDGATLVSCRYDDLVGARRYGDSVFVALSIGERQEVFRLS